MLSALQASLDAERDVTMFVWFRAAAKPQRMMRWPWRGAGVAVRGDTRRWPSCHTLLSHEIFVRSGSAGNVQQTAAECNTVHLTAHTLAGDPLTRHCGQPGSDSRVPCQSWKNPPQSRNPAAGGLFVNCWIAVHRSGRSAPGVLQTWIQSAPRALGAVSRPRILVLTKFAS